MECEICHKSPFKDNIVLHRVNEFGFKGIWRCYEDMTVEQRKQIDPTCFDICEIIKKDNERRN